MYIPGTSSFDFKYQPLIFSSKVPELYVPWYSIPESYLEKNYLYLENAQYAPLWDRVEIIGRNYTIKNLFLLKGKYLFSFEEPQDKQNFLRIFDTTFYLNSDINVFEKFNISYDDIIAIVSTSKNISYLRRFLKLQPKFSKDLETSFNYIEG